FSNPSFFSSENGRLLGSAQTLSSLRSTISPVCPAAGPPPASATPTSTAARRCHIPNNLVTDPWGPAAAHDAVGPGLQIGHHVLDLAKGRHDVGVGRINVGPAVDDDLVEFVLRHVLDRVDQVRPV